MKKALVLASDGIGDTLLSSVVISPLLKEYEVVFMVEDKVSSLYRNNNNFCIASYTRKNGIPSYPNLKKDFDIAIRCVPSLKNEGLGFLQYKSKKVLYFPYLKECQLRRKFHTSMLNIFLLNEILDVTKEEIFYMPPCKRKIIKNIVALHIGPKNKYWRNKSFPISFYKEIYNFLKFQQHDVIFIGSKDKIPYITNITTCQDEIMAGCSLSDTINLLSECLMFIGDDCGPAHLAASIGLPTIAFFGPTDPLLTAPLGDKSYYIKSKVKCSPCFMYDRFKTCNNPICHNDITINDFIDTYNIIMQEQYNEISF